MRWVTIPRPGTGRAATGRGRFTLIELLVVVAIIAILASLLLPALSRARCRAREALCANNLKQWGFALWQYTEDYNGLFPVSRFIPSGRNASDVPRDFVPSVYPYLPQFRFWFCPMDNVPADVDIWTLSTAMTRWEWNSSGWLWIIPMSWFVPRVGGSWPSPATSAQPTIETVPWPIRPADPGTEHKVILADDVMMDLIYPQTPPLDASVLYADHRTGGEASANGLYPDGHVALNRRVDLRVRYVSPQIQHIY